MKSMHKDNADYFSDCLVNWYAYVIYISSKIFWSFLSRFYFPSEMKVFDLFICDRSQMFFAHSQKNDRENQISQNMHNSEISKSFLFWISQMSMIDFEIEINVIFHSCFWMYSKMMMIKACWEYAHSFASFPYTVISLSSVLAA